MGPPDIRGLLCAYLCCQATKNAPAKSYYTIHPFIIYYSKRIQIKRNITEYEQTQSNPNTSQTCLDNF